MSERRATYAEPEHDGDRLSRLMVRAGVRDQALADVTGVSIQAVSKWRKTGQFEKGRIGAICELLGCTADELLGLRRTVIPLGRVAEPSARTTQLIGEAVTLVEKILSEGNLDLRADKKGELVGHVFEYLTEGRDVARATVLRLIRLAS